MVQNQLQTQRNGRTEYIRAMNAQRHNQVGRKKVAGDGACSVRTCIVSRAARSPEELIRFALSPAGEVVPDIAVRLPGRGAWVSNSRAILDQAIRKRAFDRAWRRTVNVPEDICDTVDALLERRALEALSMATKAGQIVSGFSNVDQRIEDAGRAILVQARDGSEDGRSRLARKYRAICEAIGAKPILVIDFSIEQISLAIGRPNVVHAALNRGRVTDAFVRAAMRVAQFRRIEHMSESGADHGHCPISPSESANELGRETGKV